MRTGSYNRNVEWEYLQWLGSMAGETGNDDPRRTYSLLLEQLFRKEFDWSVENDSNRVEDGLQLRKIFQSTYGGNDIVGQASFLEVLLGIAERLAFEMADESDDIYYWFRQLLGNAGLMVYTDAAYLEDYSTTSQVDNVLNKIIKRRYYPDGRGGLFPLRRPRKDQRNVELWYQMSDYILERRGYR